MRRGLGLSALTVAGVVFYVALVTMPGALFERQCEFGVLTAHVDGVDCETVIPVLADIDEIIRDSAVFDPELTHDLYFAGDQRWLRRIHPAPVLTANLGWPPWISQSISFRVADWSGDGLLHPVNGKRVRLRQTMAHEVVHSLQKARLGVRAANAAPLWLREGYADYVADAEQRRAPGYRYEQQLQGLIANGVLEVEAGCQRRYGALDEGGYRWPACYRLARLMWEFLLDRRGLDFEQVTASGFTSAELLAQMGVVP